MWQPSIPATRTFYVGFVAALERDIDSGMLVAGERLPTHRALAQNFGVSIGTVTRAFAEAEKLGLVVTRVGSGSYVLKFPEDVSADNERVGTAIDLSVNAISMEPFSPVLSRLFAMLSRSKTLHELMEFQPLPGLKRHRAAGAKWLALRGLERHPEQVLISSGAQEALMAVLATVTRPGDTILTESLNYAGIKRIADLFRLDIRGVPTDEEGIRPDLLQEAAKGLRVGAILVSPTLHNPTNALMPLERRREIVEIAARLGTCIIENDSYGHLSGDETQTMASLDPERCIYLCGTSKSIAPGLRIGYMTAPDGMMSRLCDGIHATSWTAQSLMGEIATILIEEGTAESMIEGHRAEALARGNLAADILGMPSVLPPRPSFHLWLPLAAPWRSIDFTAELRRRDVLVSPADFFAVDRSPVPHAIRISLGAVRDRERLKTGIERIAETLGARPQVFGAVA